MGVASCGSARARPQGNSRPLLATPPSAVSPSPSAFVYICTTNLMLAGSDLIKLIAPQPEPKTTRRGRDVFVLAPML